MAKSPTGGTERVPSVVHGGDERTPRWQASERVLPLGGTRWHSVALGGTRWHSAALGGTRWHSVALGGTRWHSVAQVVVVRWSPVVLGGTPTIDFFATDCDS